MSSPAFGRVLDHVGAAVVTGDLPAGARTSVDALVEETLASRSIVREATRVLVALGLLTAGPRVGLVVQPATRWNLLDPHVVRWRLAGPDRAAQLRELRELRTAVEPVAARAAARRADSATRTRLRDLATALDTVLDTAPGDFSRLDAALHSELLHAAGNPMLVTLGAVVALAVRDRAEVPPRRLDVRLHADLARSVADGDDDLAGGLVARIVRRTSGE
ncbi:FadR/GntR family transcriptional regulator [Kineococcus sp. TBRC 1896]|uniref:FadR/GntR family transcriptional regulator n=1 Tax=Kineococcus mangrovi TaxID=1660183 RepID=A0ABV4HYK0_9ACTN